MSKLTKFLKLDFDDKLILLNATWSLLCGRILLVCVPTDKILAKATNDAGCPATAEVRGELIQKMAWAINVAAAIVPWRSDCFVRSLAAFYWGRKLSFKPAFHLGIRRGDDGDMIAHAWVTIGDYNVTDPHVPNSYSYFSPALIKTASTVAPSKIEGRD